MKPYDSNRDPPGSLARFTAYIRRTAKNGGDEVRAGIAIQNRDGTIDVYLDALPIDGKLKLRGEDC